MLENKLEQLIELMTLEEKIGMIHGAGLFRTEGVPRLGIPPLKMSDGPMGVRMEFQNDRWVGVPDAKDSMTYLPSGSAIASTWNPELAALYGHVLGEEARGRGKDVILAPGVNIMRSPLCGRNFEYMSEDPYLVSKLAVQMVKAIQSHDVSACVKHFAANNQETNRLSVDAIVGQKALNEIYFPAFKACVQEANAYSIMGAYNKLNGEHCSHSHKLLDKVLREKWGFKNLVISDWAAVNDTFEAANSSIDIEMSVTSNFDDYYMANPLLEAIKRGEVDQKEIDKKIRNILNVMNKLHMLDDTDKRNKGSYNTKEHQEATYEIAKEAIVLLKNDENVLPMDKKIKKLLVIGDNAKRLHSKGGGSAEIKALYEVSPLEALKTKYGSDCQIDFIKGYFVENEQSIDDAWQEISLETKEDNRDDVTQKILDGRKELLEEAIKKASEYDNIIIFAGLNHDYDVESQDRKNLTLPYAQDELISNVLAINPNTVLYVLSGSCVDISMWEKKAKAILWSSYIGMEGGNVLIDTIFGDIVPSGKLAQTFAKRLNDYPSHSIGEFPGLEKVHYLEGEHVGYRHFQKYKIEPAFPFGHGLSYTSFAYEDFRKERNIKNLRFIFKVRNTGPVEGKETAQLYIRKKGSDVAVLKGFKKALINTNDFAQMVIELPESAFEVYDDKIEDFRIDHGRYEILIASSLEKIHHTYEIEV